MLRKGNCKSQPRWRCPRLALVFILIIIMAVWIRSDRPMDISRFWIHKMIMRPIMWIGLAHSLDSKVYRVDTLVASSSLARKVLKTSLKKQVFSKIQGIPSFRAQATFRINMQQHCQTKLHRYRHRRGQLTRGSIPRLRVVHQAPIVITTVISALDQEMEARTSKLKITITTGTRNKPTSTQCFQVQ